MKRCFFLCAVLSVLLLCGCKESGWEHIPIDFYFDVPQPANDSELSEMPSKFRGRYLMGDSTLIITGKEVVSEFILKSKHLKDVFNDSIKDKFSYKNGKFYADGLVYNVVEKNDSIYLSTTIKDTFFKFENDQKAKRFKGQVVLNRKDSIYWKINILSFKNDSLKWRHLSSKDDYVKLRPFVKNLATNADTTIVYLKPTRAEFRKILAIKTLGWELKYRKVK